MAKKKAAKKAAKKAVRKKAAKKTAVRKKAGRAKAAKGKAGNRKAAGSAAQKKAARHLELAPDQHKITERRARHLAEISGVEVEKIAGRTIAEAHELLKWKVAPELLLFRRVCGRVVKRDPVTGDLHPVPNATVHVEDTDCNFWGFFPGGSPWVWLYPIFCSREVLTTVRTDECGEFCVYLPYWDIDRILTFRKRRICYLDFFRPRLRDLPELIPDPPIIRDPRPQPDPPPFRFRLEDIERIRDVVRPEVVEKLEVALESGLAGENAGALDDLLDEPAFSGSFPPPLPQKLVAAQSSESDLKDLAEAMSFDLDPKLLRHFDHRRFVGPFLRCRDIFVPVWTSILDVPDITFRVTQDYDLDGVEEVIYSEGFFDVRWNASSNLNVTLEASGNALSVEHCRPVAVPCGNTASIESAGYLDIEPPYHNDATGYGVRVNRPTANGWYPANDTRVNPANAPYTGNLNLHGCFRLKQATHYRVMRSFRPAPGDPWGPQMPIAGVIFTAPRQGPGAPIPMVPDADGWYPIHPASILVHPNWIIPWRTWLSPGDGGYQLRLQLGKQAGPNINVVDTSAPRTFEVDNSKPESSFLEVRWRDAGVTGAWTNANSTVVIPTPLPDTCPIIERPTGTDIHVQVVWTASAKHLRDATLDTYGCGGGSMEMIDSPPPPPPPTVEDYRHWHTGPADNSVTQTNHFLLRGIRPPGCYTIRIRAHSRAYNPQDWDAASTMDWWVDQAPNYLNRARAISVVNV